MKILLVTLAVLLSVVRSEAYRMSDASDIFSMPEEFPDSEEGDYSEDNDANSKYRIPFHSFNQA